VTLRTEATDMFERAVKWLAQHYSSYHFFTERDIEWTLQLHLLQEIKERKLDLAVFEKHRMPNRKQVDLAVVEHATGSVLCVVELKYEPDHARGDIFPGKFPKIFWNSRKNHGVIQDIDRIGTFVESGACEVGYCLFIDEGRYHRERGEPKNSMWVDWGRSPYSESTVAALLFKQEG